MAMVEIPEPYVRNYPLTTVKREDLLELFNLFKAAPLPGLVISAKVLTRGSTYVMDDGAACLKIEQELGDILNNKEKIITGFAIQAGQQTQAPPPQISISLKLGKNEAKLVIIKPRNIARMDRFTLDGLEEGIGKILAKTARLPDHILDSPYTVMIAASLAGILAYNMPYMSFDRLNGGLIAVTMIAVLWLANRFRAYKTSYVIFETDSDEDKIQQLGRTLKKYGREIVGGAITLSISLIVLFITWFFHLA